MRVRMTSTHSHHDRPTKDTSSVERRLMHLYNTVIAAQNSNDSNTNDDSNTKPSETSNTSSKETTVQSDKPHKGRLFPTEAEVLQMKRDIYSSPLSESEHQQQSFGRISELDADTKQKIWGKLVSVHGIDLSEWKDAFIS